VTVDAVALKSMDAWAHARVPEWLPRPGIELVSYNGGMTLGGPRGGDRTVEAFDDLIGAFAERDPAPPPRDVHGRRVAGDSGIDCVGGTG
jgi:hypothetical protein